VKRILDGSMIAGLLVFAVSLGLFTIARLLPDDLGRGVFLTFIGVTLLVLTSLVAGFLAAVRSRRVSGVVGSAVAAPLAVLVAAIVVAPLSGFNASTAYLVLAGFAAIATAAGHLIGAVGVPEQISP
jgi:hypothetical protein